MSELPQGWSATTIGSVCDLVNGKAFKPSDWSDTGLPIVRIQNLNRSDAKFNHYAGPVEKRFLVKEGDLLFAWSGTPGTSFGAHIWNGPKAILNQHIFNVRFDADNLDRAFFRYAINQTLDEQIAKAHGGVGLRHVTKGKFEETPIALPPLPEQRRIVAKIDSLTGKSRRARDHLDHIPRLVEKYKQAALAAAFAGMDDAEFVRLGDATTKIGSGATPRGGSNVYKTTGVPFIRSQNIYFESFEVEGLVYIDDVAAKALDGVRVRSNDVLLNITGASIGRACIVPEILVGARVNQHVAIIRCRQELDPRYLLFFLWSPDVQGWINSENYGVTRQALTKGMIEDVKVPLLSIVEQRVVIHGLETAFAKIDRLAAEATSARKLIGRLDQAVLAKAFRGELVPQDLADEPASVLLERIRAGRAEAAPSRRRSRRPVG
ncbi:MAG TPA: restriction endonuclease subunit S [Pseudolabrys sp.]|nr:restriction endonuclease subunit S [Pseudolabrys sp.]